MRLLQTGPAQVPMFNYVSMTRREAFAENISL